METLTTHPRLTFACDAEADGRLIRFNPDTAVEAGFKLPVLLTHAAHAAAVEWSRPGDGWMQNEDARFYDVLTMAQHAVLAGLGGTDPSFAVSRIPNRDGDGSYSDSNSSELLHLQLNFECYAPDGFPCYIISLFGEGR